MGLKRTFERYKLQLETMGNDPSRVICAYHMRYRNHMLPRLICYWWGCIWLTRLSKTYKKKQKEFWFKDENWWWFKSWMILDKSMIATCNLVMSHVATTWLVKVAGKVRLGCWLLLRYSTVGDWIKGKLCFSFLVFWSLIFL